jgi:hypothetical protein
MSAEEWHGAIDVRSQLRVMARLWLCYRCYNGAALGWRRLPNGCPACEGSPREQPLTPRKQRLIACGVCRFLGDELTGEPAWYAVEVAEQFADGQSSPAELAQAHRAATAPAARAATQPMAWDAASGAVDLALARLTTVREARLATELHAELTHVLASAEAACGHLGRSAVKAARKHGERQVREHFGQLLSRGGTEDARAMAEVPRDLLGDPYEPVRLDPAWLLADGSRVRQVAMAIYETGRFDEMPILADALQDAGCTDPRLLDHCLQDRHYRGCWLLDAVLGKR